MNRLNQLIHSTKQFFSFVKENITGQTAATLYIASLWFAFLTLLVVILAEPVGQFIAVYGLYFGFPLLLWSFVLMVLAMYAQLTRHRHH